MIGQPEIVEGRLSHTRLDEAVQVAVRAFDDDPFSRYLFPTPRHRRRATAVLQRDTFGSNGRFGLTRVALVDGRVAAACLWIPPGSWPLPPRSKIRQHVITLRTYLPNLLVLPRVRATFQSVDASHPLEPHWYLQVMAVDPSVQRQGLGTALLAPTLTACDVGGHPAWLETQREENLRYYERFGFVVEQVHQPVKSVPPLWTMKRPPRS